MSNPTPLSNTELREMTKQSIARLVAHRRGAERQDDKDEITASNILMVCSRLIEQTADFLVGEKERRAYKQGWDSAGGELLKNREEIDTLATERAIKALTQFAPPIEERRRADSFHGSIYVTKTGHIDAAIATLKSTLNVNKKEDSNG